MADPDPDNPQQRVMERLQGVEFLESRLAAAEILRDRDGDGLTDIMEWYYGCDPGLADTDGDGHTDAFDVSPLCNLQDCTALERGVARALYAMDWPGQPGSAAQDAAASSRDFAMRLYGLRGLPVAAGGGGAMHHLFVASEEQRARLDEQLGFCTNYYGPQLEVYELDRGGQRYWPGGQAVESEYYYEMQEYGSIADAGVSLTSFGSGFSVLLVRINGEYYPVHKTVDWIS